MERVYRYCPISINDKNTMKNLLELDMVDYDVILDIDWLHACFASIECRTQLVKFLISNESVRMFSSSSVVPKGRVIHTLRRGS